MRTKSTVLGVPLHAALVVIPLGALPTALVLDVLYFMTGDPAWFRGAFVASAVAATGVFAAMVPGIVDYFANVPRRGEVWKHANVHAVFGLALVGYLVANAAGRWPGLADPATAAAWAAVAASALGNAALIAQAVIGRGLVLRHYITVDTEHAPEYPPGAQPPRASGAAEGPERRQPSPEFRERRGARGGDD